MLAVSCSATPDRPTELAMTSDQPAATATPVPTTAPVDVPTPRPTATPLTPPTAIPTEPPATPSALPTAAPAAASAPSEPTVPAEPPPTEAPVLPTAAPTQAPTATSAPEPDPTATAAPTTTSEPTATAEPTATVGAPATPAAAGEGGPPGSHVVSNLGHIVLGQAGSAGQVTITMPVALVELVGFHQASHPGAQAINAAGSDLRTMVLSSRGRGTPGASAADIVVPPGEPVVAPVTGTVVAATQYVLYCEHQDKLVYIEPDGLPGWQVRLFHVSGEIPPVGARVVAGQTVVATGGATQLPFESQIDEFTAEPSWPHVHVEVVDTNVPDTRPPGGGC